MDPDCRRYWQDFRKLDANRSLPEVPFDVCMIGGDRESGDTGARLVLSGTKTATSALPEEFTGALPEPGHYSVLTDGSGKPAAIFETTEVRIAPFNSVDANFARDYGEWDRTLATWRERNGAYYESMCGRLGLEWHEEREIVLERFRVVHPQ